MQDAAEFNHNPSSRAAAQKCLLPPADEETTSPLPTQAVLELAEDQQQHGAEAQQSAQDPEALPASTPASNVGDDVDPQQQSGGSETGSQDPHEQQAEEDADTDADQIPVSSSSAILSPMPPLAPQVAHPDSAAAQTHAHQTDAEILDSAMDMPIGQSTSHLHPTANANHGAVSDAAMLASSHAVNELQNQEKGVRTAAAAAAAALAPEVDDVMWPALMRQEAEGGILLIEALKRSVQSGGLCLYNTDNPVVNSWQSPLGRFACSCSTRESGKLLQSRYLQAG